MALFTTKNKVDQTLKFLTEECFYDIETSDINSLKLRLNDEELSQLLMKFYNNHIPSNILSVVEHFCKILDISLVNTENKGLLNELVDLYINNQNIFPTQEQIDKLFSCFNDKKIGVEYLRYLYSNKKIEHYEIIVPIINYLIKARQYYVDDRALLSSAMNIVDCIEGSDLVLGHEEDVNKVLERKLLEDKKANGIYDIDQFTLEELDRKMAQFESICSNLENLVQLTEEQINTLKKETKLINDDITNLRIKTLKTLKTEANKILKNFNSSYLELLNKEKESILNQKDILMSDVETEFQKKKLELEALVSSVGQRIAIELGRIRQQSDYSIDKMKEFISNNEDVKKIFDVAKEDQAFLSRLAKMDAISVPNTTIIPSQSVTTPNIIIPQQERKVDEKINYYFDRNIPFKDRFNELMQKKKEDIEKTGAIYHEKFDDLLTLILNNDAPYMYGPSGCGKTFMIEKQIAKLLGLNVVTNGYIMYETDILGFNNANGIYVPTNFYRCYKYGDMIFLDELDNSMSSSTIVLNAFIGKGDDTSYTFPNGDKIKRHPNFRILSAGNTRGNGRTVSHNTRQKLDEAVMQRLTPIEIDYDNRIEKRILQDYPDWYNFAINFRNALKQISVDGLDGPNYNGTITTRDIESIKKYKEDNSFTDEKIIEYEVIENKTIDDLNQIITEMEKLQNSGKFTEGGSVLLDKFKQLSKGRKY